MHAREVVALTALVASGLQAQQPEWQRPVAHFTVPEEYGAVAADVAADGTRVVAIGAKRVVRVYATSPLSRLCQFALPDGVEATAARIAADGTALVVPGTAGKPAVALKLADGKQVTPVPELPAKDADPPAALRALAPEATAVRTSRDGRFATLCVRGGFFLWSVDGVRELDAINFDAMLSGDGKFVLVVQTDGVVVVPAAGGDPWLVPEVGLDPRAVPFGDACRFAVIDAESIAVVDAGTRAVVQRVQIAKLGVPGGRPALLAARPDGKQFVVTWGPTKDEGEVSGWLIDVDAPGAQRLPCWPVLASWVHDGFALLTGTPGTCSTLHGAAWRWLPGDGKGRADQLATSPAKVTTYPDRRGATVPGRRELLFPCKLDDKSGARLARIDPSSGALLATQAAPSARTGEMQLDTIATPVAVDGHVIDVCFAGKDTLELRRLDDLSLLASAGLPDEFDKVGVPYVTAAEHAPRVLFWFMDTFVVRDFVAPAPTRK